MLYNGTTKKTSELWPSMPGYYYKNWQPAGNYKFNINWPVEKMEPGYYSLTVLVRRVGANVRYDSHIDTNSFYVKPSKPAIASIENMSVVVKQGESFSLPNSIKAKMSDGTAEYKPIVWENTAIDTSKTGSNTYYGEVVGYSNKIQFMLTVASAETKLTAKEIAKNSKSVLFINVLDKYGEVISTGSGFVVDNAGTVVTNYHVIEGAYSLKAVTEDAKSFDVLGIVNFDEDKDIAVLKLKDANDLPTVLLGDSDKLEIGEDVAAIGSPIGYQNTISTGIVSGFRDGQIRTGKDIQITVPISHGSSGGALFNMYGEVVGITYASRIDGQNLNFAIPINEVKPYLTGGELIPINNPSLNETMSCDELKAYLEEYYTCFNLNGNNIYIDEYYVAERDGNIYIIMNMYGIDNQLNFSTGMLAGGNSSYLENVEIVEDIMYELYDDIKQYFPDKGITAGFYSHFSFDLYPSGDYYKISYNSSTDQWDVVEWILAFSDSKGFEVVWYPY